MSMIPFLSFLAAIPAVKTEADAPPALPTFKRRWWHPRLDIRPVLWSLRNRPEDWARDRNGFFMLHKPSDHEFWAAGFGLRETGGCSCKLLAAFNHRQILQFANAVREWVRWHEEAGRQIQQYMCWGRAYHADDNKPMTIADINKQFAAHFVR